MSCRSAHQPLQGGYFCDQLRSSLWSRGKSSKGAFGKSIGEKKPSRKFDWADTNIGVNKKKAAT